MIDEERIRYERDIQQHDACMEAFHKENERLQRKQENENGNDEH